MCLSGTTRRPGTSSFVECSRTIRRSIPLSVNLYLQTLEPSYENFFFSFFFFLCLVSTLNLKLFLSVWFMLICQLTIPLGRICKFVKYDIQLSIQTQFRKYDMTVTVQEKCVVVKHEGGNIKQGDGMSLCPKSNELSVSKAILIILNPHRGGSEFDHNLFPRFFSNTIPNYRTDSMIRIRTKPSIGT